MASLNGDDPPNDVERTSAWGSIFAYGLMLALAALAAIPILAATPFAAWLQLD